jgi:hypothetical protein
VIVVIPPRRRSPRAALRVAVVSALLVTCVGVACIARVDHASDGHDRAAVATFVAKRSTARHVTPKPPAPVTMVIAIALVAMLAVWRVAPSRRRRHHGLLLTSVRRRGPPFGRPRTRAGSPRRLR